MRFPVFCVAVSAFVLAACDSGPVVVDDPTDLAQIAAALERLPQPQAGEYRIVGQLTEFEIEGESAREAQAARNLFETMMAQEQIVCRTEDGAREAYQQMIEELTPATSDCAYSRYVVDGDTVDATMLCDNGEGSTGTYEFDATVTETSQSMTFAMQAAALNQSINLTLQMDMERIGDCDAAAAES